MVIVISTIIMVGAWYFTFRALPRKLRHIDQTYIDRLEILKVMSEDKPNATFNQRRDALFWSMELDLVDFDEHLNAYISGKNPWELYPTDLREKLGK